MITRTVLRADKTLHHPLNLLLAEDNLVNQKLAVRLLEKRGHTVTVVDNGLEAVKATAKRAYDLVLMDVQMPEMDGITATTTIRAREEETGVYQPIVAMTALVMQGDRDRCLAARMDGYLSKPLRPVELDEVLDLYSARKQSAAEAAGEVAKEAAATEPAAAAEMADAVNASELLDRIDGDISFVAELAEIFRQEYPRQMLGVSLCIQQADADGLRRNAHALKGALANLSAVHAASLAASLEKSGAAGVVGPAQATLDELEAELPRVLASLDELCKEPAL